MVVFARRRRLRRVRGVNPIIISNGVIAKSRFLSSPVLVRDRDRLLGEQGDWKGLLAETFLTLVSYLSSNV